MAKEHVTWFDYDKLASMNVSIQTGDTSYFTPITSVGGFDTAGKSDLVELGKIKGVHLIDTTTLDTTDNNGLVNANEAYIDFKGDEAECGWDDDNECPNTGIIRINKSYKEAGIIPGMSIDLGTAPSLTSTGTLTTFSNSIFTAQATTATDILFVKSVNPNGDDPNEIEIGQYNVNSGSFVYADGEAADIIPANSSWPYTRGLGKYRSLRHVDGVPQYELDAQFQNRPTRVKFRFDNNPATALAALSSGAYEYYPYSQYGTSSTVSDEFVDNPSFSVNGQINTTTYNTHGAEITNDSGGGYIASVSSGYLTLNMQDHVTAGVNGARIFIKCNDTIVNGGNYKLTYTIVSSSSFTTGSFRVWHGDNGGGYSQINHTVGTHTHEFTYYGEPRSSLPLKIRDGNDQVVLSNISLKENISAATSGELMTASTPGTLSPWYGKTKWWMVVAKTQAGADNANIGDFQMFSKDNAVNMSSPIGYYAEVKIENNSKIKSEMFAVAVDGRESSK